MRAVKPWLMTDERLGDALLDAVRRVPPGGGVVFRHYATSARERRRLFLAVRRIAHARGLLVTAVGPLPGAAGRHNGGRPLSAAAHDRREALRAARHGARFLFVSPVFPTRSHPGAPALGAMAAARIARGLGVQVIALGGMDERRFRRIARLGFDGWAAIDAFALGQKRKAVPR